MAIEGVPSLMNMAAATAAGQGGQAAEKSKLKQAANDFEALLVTQLLRSARSGSAGWLGSGDDQSASSMLEMAEEFLAQAMTASGGLGLGRQIAQGLNKAEPGS